MLFKSLLCKITFLYALLWSMSSVFASRSNTDTLFSDFKAVLMYFSEAFLKDAEFGNNSLEGEFSEVMPKKIVESIQEFAQEFEKNRIINDEPKDARVDALTAFQEKLRLGAEIGSLISKYLYLQINEVSLILSSAKFIQKSAISKIDEQGGIIIPAGWVGHAIVLIIDKVKIDVVDAGDGEKIFYNLTVVNTGEGLHHHYHREDPENVYPQLSRLWIEFKNIPEDLIFNKKSAWFFAGLCILQNRAFVDILDKSFQFVLNSAANYFYGSFLSNFNEFVAKPDPSDDQNNTEWLQKLFPEQQSGTCTLSSLMAALLYHSDSLESFHWYRLNLGHVLIESFLKTFGTETDSSVKNVLTDGFYSGGMKHFKGLIRALASQQLQYLEHKFPQEFKHAGLIGSGRSKWITEKKDEAIEKLSNDSNSLNELKTTIKLAKSIHAIASNLHPRYETTHICFTKQKMTNTVLTFDRFAEMADAMNFQINRNANSYKDLIDGKPDRLELSSQPINLFNDFYKGFDTLTFMTDDKNEVYYMRFLDLFKRLHNGKGWALIYEYNNKMTLLNLQNLCKNVALKFLNLSDGYNKDYYRKLSMDEITLLGHLQLLSWNIFRAVHMIIFPECKTNWDELVPPQSVQSVILNFDQYPKIISGYSEKFWIKGFKDMENYKLYDIFIKDGKSDLTKKVSNVINYFPGPESFSLESHDENNYITLNSKLFAAIMNNNNLKEGIFDCFFNLPQVNDYLQRKYEFKWQLLPDLDAKFMTILSTGQEKLYDKIPHFYNLMLTLDILRKSVNGIEGTIVKSRQFDQDLKFWLQTTSQIDGIDCNIKLGLKKDDQFAWNWKSEMARQYYENMFDPSRDLFFSILQYRILPPMAEEASLDVWLNTIRATRNGKLFDYPRFQYMTDVLLNVPNYNEKSHATVLLFDEEKAKIIIKELTKFVRLTIKDLFDDSNKITASRRKQIVRRVSNVSVILTRFISRAEYEFKDSASPNEWAALLADLYNIIEPFSYLKSNAFKLTETDVSMLNLALSHICSINLIEPETFLNSIKLGFDYKYQMNRRTIARFHQFIAKTNYLLSESDIIADDQFKYSFSETPIAKEETQFLEAILTEKFFGKWLKGVNNYEFRYLSDFAVEITCIKDENHPPESHMKFLINMATGTIIENGVHVVSKAPFINSVEFQTYFDENNRNYLSTHGKAFSFHGVPVFILPNLSGTEYFMIIYNSRTWILRNWNNNWYIWKPKDNCKDLMRALNYSWDGKRPQIFKKLSEDEYKVELIIFDENSNDPIARVIKVINGWESEFLLPVRKSADEEYFYTVLLDQIGLEIHFKEFAESGITYAIKEDNYALVYNDYRFPDEPSKPFVILASKDKLLVKTVPNMEICIDQRVDKDGLGLPGSLVALHDGKKILLLPFKEVAKKTKQGASGIDSYVYIKKVPMVESLSSDGNLVHSPAPQSRMHKLLLAYYMVLSQNYNSARKLLHPSTSIHQNEPFSKKELQILFWILRVSFEDPESNALKLVVFAHFIVNVKKFTFDYDKENSEVIKKMHECINKDKLLRTYMMAIREIPEKYNIFKIFPDILDEDSILAEEFFGNQTYTLNTTQFSQGSSEFPNGLGYIETAFFGAKLKLENFIDLIRNKKSKEHEDLIKHLLIRNIGSVNQSGSFEMAVYCYVRNPKLWENSGPHFVFDDRDYFLRQNRIKQQYDSVMVECLKLYTKDFVGVSLANFSKETNWMNIMNTMQKDLGVPTNHEILISDNLVKVVNNEDKNVMLKFRKKLMSRVNSFNSTPINHFSMFESDQLKSSMTLASLKNSMDAYLTKKRQVQTEGLDFTADQNIFTELQNMSNYLTTRIAEIKELLSSLSLILSQINGSENDLPIPNTIEYLFSMMHQRKQKSFTDLYSCYLRNSLSCIQKKFPSMSHVECQNILDKTSLFYSHQILFDYLKMIQSNAESFLNSREPVPVDDLVIFCDEIKKISDFNKRLQNPVIMNFEYRSQKYRLKSEQVSDIGLLTKKDTDNNFKSVVIQRMMAAGKTLVLGTISVVMKALRGEDRLSILVPPSSLYQSNTTSMQANTYKYFKKKGINFSFPRLPLPFNISLRKRISSYLDNVINIITSTIKQRNYLILSPDHLQSFLNSYIELISGLRTNEGDNNSGYFGKIMVKFATIYRIFKEKSSIILDEIDMTMDPKKELNYPTINTEKFNMTAVAMLADIVEFLVFDQSIREAGLNIHSNNQAALTFENYIECKKIVLNYIESQLEDESSLWYRLVPKNISSEAVEFLKADSILYGVDWIDSLSKNNQNDLANALIIVKVQLNLYLKEFLSGTVNKNYGDAGPQRPEIKYAVPYVAANTPSPGSVFADRWETLIKTLIMISALPCPIENVKYIIRYTHEVIVRESVGRSGNEIENIPMYANLKLLLPKDIDPLELDDNNTIHVSMMHQSLALRSPAAIRILFGYYVDRVMATMEFHTEQITSNALNMVLMFISIQGYSGTIDNVNILPQKVIKYASIDHKKNDISNGGISLKLIQDFNNALIPELDDDSLSKNALGILSEMFSLYEADGQVPIEQVSAIIDTGAFFKNFTNLKVAESILQYFKGKITVVLFYDEISNQLKFIRGVFDSENLVSATVGYLENTDADFIKRTTQVDISSRFTFYDQRHITGSDILQPKNAHAIMTVDPRVLLRDILQGALRMRQFMTSQKVHIVVTKSLRKFYESLIKGDKEQLRVSDILTLGALNEDEKQARENKKLAFGKIDAEIRSFVLDEISKELTKSSYQDIDFVRISALFQSTRNIFIKSIKEDPKTWLRETQNRQSKEFLIEHAKNRLVTLKSLFDTPITKPFYKDLTKRIGEIINSVLQYLKDEIQVDTNQAIGTEVLIQTQTEIAAAAVVELDQFIQQIGPSQYPQEFDYDLVNGCEENAKETLLRVPNIAPLLGVYLVQSEERKKLLSSLLLTERELKIGVTYDLISSFSNRDNMFPVLSKSTFEGSHLLVYGPLDDDSKEPQYDDCKIALISPKHAHKSYKDIAIRKENTDELSSLAYFWLCNLDGDVLITTEKSSETPKNIFSANQFEGFIEKKIFDLLIFNGSLLQIINNPKLKHLYENVWLSDSNFKNRALFLRLRMNLIAEKRKYLLDEDDEDYVKLIQYSQGSIPSGKMKEYHEGYAKGCVINTALQSTFSCIETFTSNDRLNLKKSEIDLAKIFNVKSEAIAATESNNVDHNVSVAKGNQKTSRVDADNIKSAQQESSTSGPTKSEHKNNSKGGRSNINLNGTTRCSPFFTVAVVFMFILLVFGSSYMYLELKNEGEEEEEEEE